MAIEAQINVNVVARWLPSNLVPRGRGWTSLTIWSLRQVFCWYEIRPNLPVPNLIEDEHLKIWQTGWFACFFGVKRNPLHNVPILNTSRKPRNILMRVCLLFGSLSLVLFWQLTREWGVFWRVIKKGVLQNTRSSLHAGPLFFPLWACTRARQNGVHTSGWFEGWLSETCPGLASLTDTVTKQILYTRV
jgi:hypothetical protein